MLETLTDSSQELIAIPVVRKASSDRTSAPRDELQGVQHAATQVEAFEMENVSQGRDGGPISLWQRDVSARNFVLSELCFKRVISATN